MQRNGFLEAACENDSETPSKSLHRMLSPKGNPSMDNLAAIFGAIGSRLKVGLSRVCIQFTCGLA